MGGAEGNRGYLLQAIVALVDSLRDPDWQCISVEPIEESEKVDIRWISNSGKKRILQVKSSKNPFTVKRVERLANELHSVSPEAAWELLLIGPVSNGVQDLGPIQNVSILPPRNLDIDGMLAHAAHSLNVFCADQQLPKISARQLEMMVAALTTRMLRHGTLGHDLTRAEFIREVRECIPLSLDRRSMAIYFGFTAFMTASLTISREQLSPKITSSDVATKALKEAIAAARSKVSEMKAIASKLIRDLDTELDTAAVDNETDKVKRYNLIISRFHNAISLMRYVTVTNQRMVPADKAELLDRKITLLEKCRERFTEDKQLYKDVFEGNPEINSWERVDRIWEAYKSQINKYRSDIELAKREWRELEEAIKAFVQATQSLVEGNDPGREHVEYLFQELTVLSLPRRANNDDLPLLIDSMNNLMTAVNLFYNQSKH